MKNRFKTLGAIALAIVLTTSCDNDEVTTPEVQPEVEAVNNFVGTVDGAYYIAYNNELTSGSLSFVNNGTQLDADQAARVIATGGFVYSLNYGTGLLSQLQAKKDGAYETLKEINVGLAVGTTRPRYKLAGENTIMVYNVVTEAVKNDANEVTDYTCTLRLASIDLPSLAVSNLTEFVIPQSANAKIGGTIGYHPMRVDSPVIAGDKIYFGLMHMDIFDPSTPPPFRKPKQTGLETLVFDYPSFGNGKITQSDASNGHTGGYRAPSMHIDEKGDVYQSNWFMSANNFDLSKGDKTVITRLKNGSYDTSYVFNVSEALGLSTNVGTVGWFYVGNGIGYMPIHMENAGNYYSEDSWSVAKIDLNNKTAVKLDVPNSQLFTYESGVVRNGKFYMAISPKTGEANVYEFDPSNDKVTKGLKLDGANVHIEGIY
ncbi:MAG: hypothetical protein H6584_05065 [Flavobacteriales bacterium]|nr:hypothetical protein [Flavobacteriales bacterium]